MEKKNTRDKECLKSFQKDRFPTKKKKNSIFYQILENNEEKTCSKFCAKSIFKLNFYT